MERINSFSIDHIKLKPGLYVSRIDKVNDGYVTTFDIRITSPNDEPVLNTAEVHTIEHLGATYLRNKLKKDMNIIYFGPMGCRTGFYFIVEGKLESKDMLKYIISMFEFIRDYTGEIPGAKPEECGNYLDQNLNMAKYVSNKYLNKTLYVIDDSKLNYPK